MNNFRGFGDSESFTGLPDSFFRQLLGDIDSLQELKVALFALWHIEHLDGSVRGLTARDFDEAFLGLTAKEVELGLEKAVARGILLRSQRQAEVAYFLNSARGRATAKAFASGQLEDVAEMLAIPLERPNVFKLYEENIGPLTPLIADALKDAELVYSEEWIADAIGLAVKNNKRNWRYCEAILKRWKEEGRATKQNRRDDPAARQRELEEKINKFIGG